MHCSFRTSGTGYSAAQLCPRKEFSCTPPYICQDSHTSDVLPISQTIMRNIRAECLFSLRTNDIHTPFRHFELASTRLTFRQPTLPRQVPAKLSRRPRTLRLSSACRRSLWCSSVRQTHLNSPSITALWRANPLMRYIDITVHLVAYHGIDRKGGAPETGHARPSS